MFWAQRDNFLIGIFFLDIKDIIIAYAKYLLYQNDLVGIKVSLTDLYLCNGASCNIAAVYLELCGKLFLGYILFLTQQPYVFSYGDLNLFIHGKHVLRQK